MRKHTDNPIFVPMRAGMDYTMLDVTGIAEVEIGTRVILIGNEPGAPTAHELAKLANTVPWEILACISQRVPRFYKTQNP